MTLKRAFTLPRIAPFVIACGMFSGCAFDKNHKSPAKDLSYEIEVLKIKLKNNENEITNIKEDIEFIQKSNSTIENKIFSIEFNESNKNSAFFNLYNGSSGFQAISVPSGNLLVSVQKVEPYLSGYKLILSIGNPTYATYQNTNMKIRWNQSSETYRNDTTFIKKIESYENEIKEYTEKLPESFLDYPDYASKRPQKPTRPSWADQFKEKEISILKDLKPGSWNSVEVYLTPCTLEELEHVVFVINTNIVSLFTSEK